MSDSEPPAKPDSSRRRPFLIENALEKETSESFIERHFLKTSLHRSKDAAEYDIEGVVERFGSDLVRSTQELQVNPEGKGHIPTWTMLVFKRPGPLFWHFVLKTNNNYGAKAAERIFSLTVTGEDPTASAADALMLRQAFTVSDDGPGFFLIRSANLIKRIPLRTEFALSREDLDLHYGSGFADWSDMFLAGLNQNGLSILRGAPGTGKTSYIRHLILNLASTHRFYYLPVDSFSLLQGGMPDFLAKEQKRFPHHHQVLVLEDAELLLLNRRDFRDGLASSLLNFTDGFIGDMVRCHLICTLNSEIKDLDDAVLRPGRQRFFREFTLLPWSQASALAAKLNITLSEERSYSLAEIYHFTDTQTPILPAQGSVPPIGFRL